MLEYIRDGSQYHPSINKIESPYKIRDFILKSQEGWKGVLLSTRNTSKGLHKLFKDVIHDILQVLHILGESGSEASYIIPEPINFAEVTRLSEYIKKPWIKADQKYINNLINNQTLIVQETENDEPVTSCMDVY